MKGIDLSKMTAAELDELIAEASYQRSHMKPEVKRVPPERDIPRVNNPLCGCVRLKHWLSLQIRHPGLGWVAFWFDDEAAVEFVDRVTKELNGPPRANAVFRPRTPPTKGGSGPKGAH